MADTSIEWAEKVWNPTTGCDRVSPGCDHCYALTMAKRLKAMGSAKYQRDGDDRTSGPGFGVTEHPDELTAPLGWRTGRRVFVNSMSDLFHDNVSTAFLARVFAVMAATPRHTYQVLTKRHSRMRSLLSSDPFRRLVKDAHSAMQLGGVLPYRPLVINEWPLPNVWLGVSVESQQWADIRIPALLDTPAAVRWLSCEPLLGPVRLAAEWLAPKVIACWTPGHQPDAKDTAALATITRAATRHFARENGKPAQGFVDWVVVGGESGPGARPMHPAWARSLRDQCTAAAVPFLFKQWGNWRPLMLGDYDGATPIRQTHRFDDDETVVRVGKGKAGRVLDGRTWDEYPETWAGRSREDGAATGAPNQSGGA